jgi:hypothetical protein
MEKEIESQEEIRSLAGQVMHKTDLLIHLCNNILPEEEGMKNVFRRFTEREKSKRKANYAKLKHRLVRFFKSNK